MSSSSYVHVGWGQPCRWCGIRLLEGESSSFCCRSRRVFVPSLPPLPVELSTLMSAVAVRAHSRALDSLFNLTSVGVFSVGAVAGFQNQVPPGFLAVAGRIYHHVRSG